MVLIVVSTTTSLFLGKQDMLEHRYIHDLEVTWENGKMLDGYAKKLISRKAEEFHLSIEREYDVNSAKISLFRSQRGDLLLYPEAGRDKQDVGQRGDGQLLHA